MGHTPGTGNAQDMSTLLGKVIRIDVDNASPGKLYGIPADNPFVAQSGVPPEIFANGFRNPAYATFDSAGSHRMFIAMAGQRLFESVLIVYRGGAYPWNIREGTHCFDPSNDFAPPGGSCPTTTASGRPLIGPVAELGHDVGDTVIGGVLYRGSALPALQGMYLYGTWSDDNRILGNGTLLAASPPAGLDIAALPSDATALTPVQNAMWTTRTMTVANNANGRINAFVRAISENDDHEALVLINQNGGVGLTPQGSGEVWEMVPADTPGLVRTDVKAAPATAPAQGPGSGTPVTVQLTIRGDKFIPVTLAVPAGAPVTLVYNDQDQDPHNFALYASPSSSAALFRSPLITGPVTQTYTFTAPSVPGTYYFRSDPNTGLQGNLTVTAGTAAAGTVPTTMPAPAAVPVSTTLPPPAPGAGPAVPITLTAENLTFSASTLSAPAGATVTMTFINRDTNMPHNFALYTNASALTKIFAGDLVTGPKTVTYTFTVPSEPGSYFFRCDVHPELMTGTFVVT
jgi:plastocyanin